MYTSALLLALATYSAQSGIVSITPRWMDDYSIAYERGQKEKKPLAVFVGSGPQGWNRLSRDGRLGKELEQILGANYVCVYLDTDKEENQKLASSFDLTRQRGLIISDHSGAKQAYRAEESLNNAELARSLKKFADPDLVVTTTETPVRPVTVVPASTIRVQRC
jgi:hypothetical protein